MMLFTKTRPPQDPQGPETRTIGAGDAAQVGWTIPEPHLIGPGNLGRRPGACR